MPVGRATLWRVPPAVYFGPEWADRISASDLKEFGSSPWAYYERKILGTAPKKESAAMRYGELLHLWHELSDEIFWPRVEIAPDEFVTAGGELSKKGEGWLAGLAPGKIGLSPGVRDRLWRQTRQILLNPKAVELIGSRVDAEFCLQWDWNGHPMRCRVDGATDEFFYDLKTTADPRPLDTFHSSVRQFQYDLQCAIYENGAVAAGWEPHSLHFIVTSTAYPYHCHVVTLPRDVTDLARDRALRLLDELHSRREWDSWLPADYGQVTELWCPGFMRGKNNDGWGE